MGLYTFYVFQEDGISTCFEVRELPYDSAAFPVAGDMLKDHGGAAYVSVWEDERPVLSRYREPPTVRLANDEPRPSV